MEKQKLVRYDKNHHRQTHNAIVAAASTLLREKGFAETSVGTVMKSVGLTHGGFYAHFEDKTAMLTAAMQEAFQQSPLNFAGLAQMATASGDAGVIAKHYLSDGRVKDVASGCPAAALVGELPRQEAEVQKAFQNGTYETLKALAQTPGLSEQQNAWAALSMLMGGLMLMRALPDTKTNTEIRTQISTALRQLAKEQV
jgi:TetR/AcrR family transcriptional regulator, transcriptional repressor for nem operon